MKIYKSFAWGMLVMAGLLFGKYEVSAQLTVEAEVTPEAAVAELAGRGVKVRGQRFAGAPGAMGVFSHDGDLPLFASGVVLSSGLAADMAGPNDRPSVSTYNMRPGLKDLDPLAKSRTFDAAALDFDFMTDRDSFSLDFMFASEEYNDYVGKGFQDVIVVVLKGPGLGNGRNLALLPGTQTPININSLNVHKQSQYYLDNNPFDLNGTLNEGLKAKLDPALLESVQYDGLSKVFSVGARVKPMTKYHLQIIVADGGDANNDSALLLGGKSLQSHEQYWRVVKRRKIAEQRRLDSLAQVQAIEDSIAAVAAAIAEAKADSVAAVTVVTENTEAEINAGIAEVIEERQEESIPYPVDPDQSDYTPAVVPQDPTPATSRYETNPYRIVPETYADEVKLVFLYTGDDYFLSEPDEILVTRLIDYLTENPSQKIGLFTPTGSQNDDLRYDMVRLELIKAGVDPERIFQNGFSFLSSRQVESSPVERLEVWVR